MEISRQEIERYLGYRKIHASDPKVTELILECTRDMEESMRPASVYQVFPVEWKADGSCSFAGMEIRSRSLLRSLKSCTEAAMLAVTIGPGPDLLIRRAEVRSMLKACVYQAAGAAAVEAWCDEVNEKIRREAAGRGLFPRPRFSPGYGDFPLEAQRDFERVLQMRKKAGIALTDSLLMVPSKSVTAVIGLSPEPGAGKMRRCRDCGMSGSCAYQCE